MSDLQEACGRIALFALFLIVAALVFVFYVAPALGAS